MSNIHDVAEEAGVSAMTVSRYYNQPGKLAPATRERVAKVIQELQYVPNAAARSLVSGETTTVAAVLSDITNAFFTTLARGIEDVAQRHEYTLFVGNTDDCLEKEQDYLETLISRRVDGVLLSPAPGTRHQLGHYSRESGEQIAEALVEQGQVPEACIAPPTTTSPSGCWAPCAATESASRKTWRWPASTTSRWLH